MSNSYNFIPYINAATRPFSNTCLDHIFVYNYHKHYKITPTIIDTLITDHYPILLQLTQRNQNYKNRTENENNITNQNNINYECVNSHFIKTDWNIIKDTDSANNKLKKFTMVINEIILKSTFTHKKNGYNKNPWIKPGIIRAIKKRDKMHNIIKYQPFNTILKNKYKMYIN